MKDLNIYITVAFFVWMAVLLGGGTYLARKAAARSTGDFAVAGGSLGPVRLIGMNLATYVSAVTLIGFSGYAYASGFALWGLFFGTLVGYLPLALIGKRLQKARHNTLSEYLGHRYGSSVVRAWFGLAFAAVYTLFLMLQLVGISVLMQTLAGLPGWLVSLVVIAVLTVYVAIAGMPVVSLLDSLQALIIFGAVILAGIIAVVLAGGFGDLFQQARAIDPALLSATGGGSLTAPILLGAALGWMGGVACRADFAAMAFSAARPRLAATMFGVTPLLIVVVYLALNMIGLSAAVNLPNLENPDAAFPAFFDAVLPGWLSWLMVLALISGIVTSCDSYLLTISSVTANDVLKPFGKGRLDDRQVLRVARIAAVAAAGVAYVISIQDLPIIAIASLTLFAVWGSTVFVPLYGAFFWRTGNAAGALAGSVVGLAVSVTWAFVRPIEGEGLEAIAGLLTSFVVYVGVSVLTRRSVAEREAAEEPSIA
ncbi:MAG: hypothetical protein GEV03_16310 [Streptosporangiales bacterium]|nr:hypothetical protein [Streptosporangiales bacterium]